MSTYVAKLTKENDFPGAPAFEALRQAPDEFRHGQTAAVYYVTLHIDARNANRIEEDMTDLKFAFDGFGEAKLYRVDEVGAISIPGYIVAIPEEGKPPLMGALAGKVVIQKLPKESRSEHLLGEDDREEGWVDGKKKGGQKARTSKAEVPAKKGKKKSEAGIEAARKSGRKN